jgi:acetyl/propionyl-CoA carboxylase alpha subunit
VFSKILIADRGLTAVRIARTCERLGVHTIAVAGDGDASAPHVLACGECVSLPGPTPDADPAALVNAAKERGAEAVHAGASDLAGRAAFAELVARAGIAFVGAPREVLVLAADRDETHALAVRAGVRAARGADVALRDLDDARRVAEDIGAPFRVAPVVRCGVRARTVDDLDGLLAALEEVSRAAQHACGDGRVRLEQCVDRPRRLDVQVVADANAVLALGERESSVRHGDEPLVCEQPAPALLTLADGEERTRALHEAAVDLAREAGVRGVATLTFLLDSRSRAFFVRLDPRLAPDHVATEMYAGVDLVEEQLRIACGEGVSAAARRTQPTGHAVQAFLYCDAANAGAAPVETLRWPLLPPGSLRVETTLAPGSPPEAARLIATVSAYHQTRHRAVLTLDRVLAETAIAPVPTNLARLRRLLGDDAFRAGQYDAEFVARMPE